MYELKMMREVVHPNLLETLEIYEGDHNIYCLGKLLAGENLTSVISDKKYQITKEDVLTMANKMLQVG